MSIEDFVDLLEIVRCSGLQAEDRPMNVLDARESRQGVAQ